MVDIQTLYGNLFRLGGFRARRMEKFRRALRITQRTTILDVGGFPGFWSEIDPYPHLTILNMDRQLGERVKKHGDVEGIVADGTRLPVCDNSFDVVFSNSVIEHLSSWNAQQQFARESRRAGSAYWIQTPARSFPIEPHFLAPFIHWLPARWRRKLARNCTIWGWLTRPDTETVDRVVAEIRLLSFDEMKSLFPDGTIIRERWCGLTKSYIAVRESDGAA